MQGERDIARAFLGRWVWCGIAAGAGIVCPTAAQTIELGQPTGDPGPVPAPFSVHAQFTETTQAHPDFRSPYAGPNSLRPSEPAAETADLTLFLRLRPWRGGELEADPEIDQGYGLSDTQGIAGFPSGEAYKVGSWTPYARVQRAFVRQTFGGEAGGGEPGPQGAALGPAADRLTLTVGKFSVVDVFDTNTYAHDPRADFMNWSLIDGGAFDYAADAWGYTLGAAVEWAHAAWTGRAGFFALSTQPNAESLDSRFRQNSALVEVERRFALGQRPGAFRMLAFVDRGKMATYADALAAGGPAPPEPASARRTAGKPGVALNVEQEIADGAGLFARASADDGRYEAFEFTEINRSVAAGISLDGSRWHRPGDKLGIGAVVNGLSPQARAFFAAGGRGILIGDGRLPHAGNERITETFYAAQLDAQFSISADCQFVWNPAYNTDRGPVRVFGLRVHAAF